MDMDTHLCLYDEWQQVCVVVCVHDGVKAALQDVHGCTHAVLNTTCTEHNTDTRTAGRSGQNLEVHLSN